MSSSIFDHFIKKIPQQYSSFLFSLFLFLVILTSFILNIKQLNSYSLDSDEIFSVNWSRFYSIPCLLFQNCYDTGNPPLHFIILKLWLSVWGVGDFQARFLSLIFSICTLIFVGIAAQKVLLFSRFNTVFSVSAIAFSSVIQFYFRYARGYGLLMFACIGSYVSLMYFLFVKKENNKNWGMLSIFFISVGLYTHYTFVIFLTLLVVSTSIVIFFEKKNKKKLFLKCAFIILISLFLFSPWAARFLYYQFFASDRSLHYELWQRSLPAIEYSELISYATNQVINLSQLEKKEVIAASLIVFFLCLLLVNVYKSSTLPQKIFSLFTFLLLASYCFTDLYNIFRLPKYTMYFLLFIPLSFFQFLEIFSLHYRKLTIALLLFFSFFYVKNFGYFQYIEDWKSVSENIRRSDSMNTVIVVSAEYLRSVLSYYYPDANHILCFKGYDSYSNCDLTKEMLLGYQNILFVQADWNISQTELFEQEFQLIDRKSYSKAQVFHFNIKKSQ